MQSSDAFTPQYGTLVYNGFWFSPEREALQALVTETQRDVAGVVRLKLYKGNIIIAGRKSPKSLYDPKLATMEAMNRSANGRIRRGEHMIKAMPQALFD